MVELKKTLLALLSSLKAADETYLQGNGSVGQEAGLQGVHQVHIVARHLDPDVLPARLFIGPLRRAVTAVHNQIRAASVARAGFPQSRNYAQKNQRSHGGLSLCSGVKRESHPSRVTSFWDAVRYSMGSSPRRPRPVGHPLRCQTSANRNKLRVRRKKVRLKSVALFKFAGETFLCCCSASWGVFQQRSDQLGRSSAQTEHVVAAPKIGSIHTKPVSFPSEGAQRRPPLSSRTPRVLGLVVLGSRKSPPLPGPDMDSAWAEFPPPHSANAHTSQSGQS